MLSPLKPTLFCTACCRFNGAAGGASGKLWWITGWQLEELWSRAAYPAPSPEVSPALSRKMKSNTLCAQLPSLCVSPPSLLTKTETGGTSTWFTELWAVTAGERSYLSVPLPFCHRDRRPWRRGRAISGGSVVSSCLLMKPQMWWIRALAGRRSRFPGFITAISSESLPATQSWLFSDHPVLSETVRWSQILRKPRSERHGWMRLWRRNCPKIADWSRAQH